MVLMNQINVYGYINNQSCKTISNLYSFVDKEVKDRRIIKTQISLDQKGIRENVFQLF